MQQRSIDIRNFFWLLDKKLEIIYGLEEKHSKIFQVFWSKCDRKYERV